MYRVVWSDDALDQLKKIESYIAAFDPGAADRIVGRLSRLGDSLVDFPNRGRPVADGMRELTTVPPYVIGYDVIDDLVSIIQVRHGRQHPPQRR